MQKAWVVAILFVAVATAGCTSDVEGLDPDDYQYYEGQPFGGAGGGDAMSENEGEDNGGSDDEGTEADPDEEGQGGGEGGAGGQEDEGLGSEDGGAGGEDGNDGGSDADAGDDEGSDGEEGGDGSEGDDGDAVEEESSAVQEVVGSWLLGVTDAGAVTEIFDCAVGPLSGLTHYSFIVDPASHGLPFSASITDASGGAAVESWGILFNQGGCLAFDSFDGVAGEAITGTVPDGAHLAWLLATGGLAHEAHYAAG